MASAKRTLDPAKGEVPETKTDVTKKFMLRYMKDVASKEDVIWFAELIQKAENRKMYTNRLNGEKYEDIDIPKVREAFCARFYPSLNEAKKGTKSFTDTILALRDNK